jgi:hypothetical protein
MVLACADGAGSVALADVGSRLACKTAVRLALRTLQDTAVADVDRSTVVNWFSAVRNDLNAAGWRRGASRHDLACTLLLAVLGETAAVFAQVGDGVMVVRRGGGYQPVFWPQSGEYANSTFFVTDDLFAHRLDFVKLSERIEETALLTDGLQSLALNLAARTVHEPFFRPMFARLRASQPGEGLPTALRRFLDSPAINSRSDDDKTLILATREPPRETAPTA